MKKVIFLGILFLSTTLFAQQSPEKNDQRKEKREKIEAMKIAFITRELSLSEDESKKFWPIYNDMEEKIRTENQKQRKLGRELKENSATLSETEQKKKASDMLQSSINEAQIKKDYYDKIGGAIGYSKATKLLSLEQQFKRELLNRVNNGHPSGNRPPAKE